MYKQSAEVNELCEDVTFVDESPTNLVLFNNCSNGGSHLYTIKSLQQTVTVFTRSCDHVRLLDRSCELFADNVWPGALVLADYLDSAQSAVCSGKRILEFGAGCMLPSVVAAKLGANLVVATDFNETSVICNMRDVIKRNGLEDGKIIVAAHCWGEDVASLLALNGGALFDVLLLAELLWKDTYPLHGQLLTSVVKCLAHPHGVAILSFAHRPTQGHTAADDLHFFQLAEEVYGLRAKYLGSNCCYPDLYEYDDNKIVDNAEVHLYALTFNESSFNDVIESLPKIS